MEEFTEEMFFELLPVRDKIPVYRKLAEIGDLRKLSPEELELYDEDIKNMRDWYSVLKFEYKKNYEKAVKEEKISIVRRMLGLGCSDQLIAEGTGLPLEEIQNLKS